MRIKNYINRNYSKHLNRFSFLIILENYQLWDIVKFYSIINIGLIPFPYFDLSFALSLFEAHVCKILIYLF